MGAHSVKSPSAMHRLIRCPGSVILSKDIPDTTSEAALEGTCAHWLAEEMLRIKSASC